jgi:hypothetical protein
VNLAIRTFVFLFMGIAGRNVSPVSFREALRASGVVSEMTFAVRGILLCRKAEEKAIPLEKREKPPVRNHSEGGFLLFKTRKKRFEEGKRAVSGVFYAGTKRAGTFPR